MNAPCECESLRCPSCGGAHGRHVIGGVRYESVPGTVKVGPIMLCGHCNDARNCAAMDTAESMAEDALQEEDFRN